VSGGKLDSPLRPSRKVASGEVAKLELLRWPEKLIRNAAQSPEHPECSGLKKYRFRLPGITDNSGEPRSDNEKVRAEQQPAGRPPPTGAPAPNRPLDADTEAAFLRRFEDGESAIEVSIQLGAAGPGLAKVMALHSDWRRAKESVSGPSRGDRVAELQESNNALYELFINLAQQVRNLEKRVGAIPGPASPDELVCSRGSRGLLALRYYCTCGCDEWSLFGRWPSNPPPRR
jgi:hypothetical protein